MITSLILGLHITVMLGLDGSTFSVPLLIPLANSRERV
jgi:hypothetical protein